MRFDAPEALLFGKKKRASSARECTRTMTAGEKIGQLLRARRKFLHLRQRDLAELAGIALRGLTAIERGRGNPTLKQLSEIASVLGLEVTLTKKQHDAES